MQCKVLYQEIDSFLRTKDTYMQQVAANDPSSIGVVEGYFQSN